MLLDDRVALVTGASTGIGREIAGLFAGHGARLILLDRNAEPNQAAAHSLDPLGQRAIAFNVDVRDRPGRERPPLSVPEVSSPVSPAFRA